MKKIIFCCLLALSACIGTDIKDDVIVDRVLTINQEVVPLMLGSSFALNFSYSNQYGIEQDIEPNWSSDTTSVATVNQSGVVSAVGVGQANVTASFEGVTSAPVRINVVGDENDVAKVLIVGMVSNLDIDETFQFMATAWNVLDEELPGMTATWSVNDPTIASISATGLLTALSKGEVEVTATIDGIESTPYKVLIGDQGRSATLMGTPGYTSNGTATLSLDDSGNVILSLSDDFNASIALGTYIYLSNTTDGGDTKSGGLNLGEITSAGAKTFTVSDPGVTLQTYDYVVVLCKPAAITFGFGKFNP